ncbi:MAG: hypothetical protein PHS09_05685 [Candidatus Omnitrophica bacterium]|nr:hypothetical protein [Candidatus Omnitrophota bacterium]
MEGKGLCLTCIKVKSCIFARDTYIVWQCEEFSSGNHVATGHKPARAGEATIPQEVALESE